MHARLATVVLSWMAVAAAFAQPPAVPFGQHPEAVFPLGKGTVWVYEGLVRWTLPGSDKKLEKKITWKIEIVDTVRRDSLLAAVVKGHPADLAWYEEERTPGDYWIIRLDPGKFYLVEPFRFQEVRRRLENPADRLDALVRDEELFLDSPLAKGKKWGEPEALKRDDLLYQWLVEEERPVRLRIVQGVEAADRVTQYRLAYRTLPDHTVVDFVPGVGIIHYVYAHHGTVAEADVKLVEYHAGR
ncbi:MAG: hypothetical protein ACRD35_04155 [Candidatus Acidiferrales bacterium]